MQVGPAGWRETVRLNHTSEAVEDILARSGDVSIISLVNALVGQAHAMRASDVHIDPTRDHLRVRMRIDGVLQETTPLPKRISQEIISRIKVLSGMRTDEHQATQDGRFRHVFQGGGVLDMRVSIAPTYHGENVVLRLLSGSAGEYTLQMLGFEEERAFKVTVAPVGTVPSQARPAYWGLVIPVS